MPGWQRVTSRFPRPHMVYCQLELEDGRRLTVSRVYGGRAGDPGRPFVPGEWRWKVFGPGHTPRRPGHTPRRPVVLAEGLCSSDAEGRRLGDGCM